LHRALVEAAGPPAHAIDDPEFLNLEIMPEFVQHAHLFGHVVTEARHRDLERSVCAHNAMGILMVTLSVEGSYGNFL
jgi:hypothetical protein